MSLYFIFRVITAKFKTFCLCIEQNWTDVYMDFVFVFDHRIYP